MLVAEIRFVSVIYLQFWSNVSRYIHHKQESEILIITNKFTPSGIIVTKFNISLDHVIIIMLHILHMLKI